MGVTGKDDAFFVLDVKKDHVLENRFFSRTSADEPPRARIAAFSISEVVFRYLKLSFGRRLLMVDLYFDEEEPCDSFVMSILGGGLGMGEKFTLFGVRFGVKGMFTVTKSSAAASPFVGGISRTRVCHLPT